ncbi:MAG: 4-(cytidine 5'-diphospho)-2-C-methyl-D-erythritol kinase [Actinomycetota bacterium]
MEVKNCLKVKSASKINLYLSVSKNGRDDGYHDIKSIMQSLSLSDELYFEVIKRKKANPASITITSDNVDIPLDERNLVYKAARLILEEYNLASHYTVKINIKKSIPVSAGLAGGSTNAAATLVALNELLGLKLTKKKLINIASRIGSDVPFCISGGTALAEGRGEIISELPNLPFYWVVLAKNGKKFGTKEVYEKFDNAGKEKRSIHDRLVEDIYNKNFDNFLRRLFNDLEEVGLLEDETILKIKQTANKLGAIASQMTGSGPTVFAVCDNLKLARDIYNSLKSIASSVFLTHTKSTGQSFVGI